MKVTSKDITKDPKRVIKSQKGLATFLKASTTKEFFDHHATPCGTIIVITRDGHLLTKTWRTYYQGEVSEKNLQEMLDFINQ